MRTSIILQWKFSRICFPQRNGFLTLLKKMIKKKSTESKQVRIVQAETDSCKLLFDTFRESVETPQKPALISCEPWPKDEMPETALMLYQILAVKSETSVKQQKQCSLLKERSLSMRTVLCVGYRALQCGSCGLFLILQHTHNRNLPCVRSTAFSERVQISYIFHILSRCSLTVC